MKRSLILLLITLPIIGLSQKNKSSSRSVYKTVQGLNLIDTITWAKIKDDFSIGNGRVSYIFQLDSNNTFKYVEFGDVATITLDHGTWSIRKKKSLVLRSKKKKYYFDVVKFGNFLFYISPEQRHEFVEDFKKEQIGIVNYKIDLNEPQFTKESIIAFHLTRKYYGAELIH